MKLHGKGKSSFDLIDKHRLSGLLRVEKGLTFLDLGCGRGEYTMHVAELANGDGTFYAMDLWDEGIEELKAAAENMGLASLRGIVGDITGTLPLNSGEIDMCLMSTVLHDIVKEKPSMLEEVKRVLKPGARLVVIEFRKIQGPPGPPLEVRMSPEEVKEMVSAYGFRLASSGEIGDYNYLMEFTLRD